ncbi:MAG: biotin--protein ligase [Candidatus Micrarchaeota archaeon]|nr:biotin--protein ligase [Candidatus Micrarchaeota archaeon]
MKGFAEMKVPGGKLLAIRVDYSDRIDKIEILGDFFIHPEECLEAIENSLTGIEAASSASEIVEKVDAIVARYDAELIGVNSQAIADTIKSALK